MQFHKMLCVHIPSQGKYGDCWRTAIACLLDMHPSEVPHWLQEYPTPPHLPLGTSTPERDAAFEAFLNSKNLSHVDIPYQPIEDNLDSVWATIAENNGEDLVYLATGIGASGHNHVVIMRGRELLWDPSPLNAPLKAAINGLIWITLLLPLFMRYKEETPVMDVDPTSFAIDRYLEGSISEDKE